MIRLEAGLSWDYRRGVRGIYSGFRMLCQTQKVNTVKEDSFVAVIQCSKAVRNKLSEEIAGITEWGVDSRFCSPLLIFNYNSRINII